jgi:hypothetical protein
MIARTLKWEEDSGQGQLDRTTMTRQQGHESQKAKVYGNKHISEHAVIANRGFCFN